MVPPPPFLYFPYSFILLFFPSFHSSTFSSLSSFSLIIHLFQPFIPSFPSHAPSVCPSIFSSSPSFFSSPLELCGIKVLLLLLLQCGCVVAHLGLWHGCGAYVYVNLWREGGEASGRAARVEVSGGLGMWRKCSEALGWRCKVVWVVGKQESHNVAATIKKNCPFTNNGL